MSPPNTISAMLDFRLLGITVRVSYVFLFAVVMLSFFDKSGFFAASFLAVVFHETAHLAAMRLTTVAVNEVSFKLGTVSINADAVYLPSQKAIIAVFGPAVNFILTALYFCDSRFLKNFGIVNLALGVFNVLPISGLDGGDIAYFLICKLCKNRADKIFKSVSIAVLLLCTAAVAVLFLQNDGNIMLVTALIYLFIMSFFKV